MKPILFNTDMVKAILDGRKTVTRRVIKPKYKPGEAGWNIVTNKHTGEFCYCEYYDEYEESTRRLNPPHFPGDTLYVRETWGRTFAGTVDYPEFVYRATDPEWGEHDSFVWHPSIHMPKEAARIFLLVTDVRAERLQDITTEGAAAEGAETDDFLDLVEEAGAVGLPTYNLREYFGYHIWDRTLNSPDAFERYGWDANPWVWVIEFERCQKPQEVKP